MEVLTHNREWDQARDTPRVRQAFLTLARTRRTWPVPADFNEAIPAHRVELVALPSKPSDPAKVEKIMTGLAKTLGVR